MSIAIIVPYRDRLKQLKVFDEYFKNYLKDYNYKIFVIEQTNDGLKFNRGILLNIGFRAAMDYDIIIYHDVDLLPSDDLKIHYTKPSEDVIHIASSWTRYNSTGANIKYIGGITRISASVFRKIGGFPTLYWGWGGEDDEVYMRLLYNKIDIIRPKAGSNAITDLEDLSLDQKMSFLKKNDLKCMEKYEINNFYNVRRFLDDFVLIDNLPRLLKESGLEDSGYQCINKDQYSSKYDLNSSTIIHYVIDISGPYKMAKEDPDVLLNDLKNNSPSAYNNVLKECYYSNFTTRKFISGFDILAKEAKHNDAKNKTREEILEKSTESIVSSINPEFRWFSQSIFHAGSESQFFEYADVNIDDPKYTKIVTTFRYMFTELKKGLYVQIKNGILHVFLPFSNADYSNTWAANLRTPPGYRKGDILKNNNEYLALKKSVLNYDVSYMVAYCMENDAYENKTNKTKINPKVQNWYANNYMFRNTLYDDTDDPVKFGHIDEGDKSIYLFLKFFVELVSNRQVPDCHLFINPRDMPVHKKDLSHPYPTLYPNNSLIIENARLRRLYNNNNILNIFSGATTDEYADIPMPTDDDIKNYMWSSAVAAAAASASSLLIDDKEWSQKKNIAFFRGSATGQYIDLKNERIQAAYLSQIYPTYLDIGLVSFNKRLKVVKDNGECAYINTYLKVSGKGIFDDDRSTRPLTISDLKKPRVEMKDQKKYKYILDIRGHSAAYRLPQLLNLGSVILKVDSPFKMFSERDLKGLYYDEINEDTVKDIHYVKIRAPGDIISAKGLINSIEFLRKHDQFARVIANNALMYHKQYINRDHMFDYMLTCIKE